MVQILDAYGRPAKLDPEPLRRPDQVDRFQVSPNRPTHGITPQRITSIFREADDGYPERQAELFADMLLKDGRLAGQFGVRTKSAAKLDWQLQPASDSPADKKVVDRLLPKLRQLSLRGSFRRLLSAVGFGYAAEQIHWGLSGGEVEVLKLDHWPTAYLAPDPTGAITRYRTALGMDREELPPAKFVVHAPAELGPLPSAAGLLRPAAWFWLFKNFVLKSWVQYAEIFGQPLRSGTYPRGASDEEKQAGFSALVQMGHEAVAMLPEGFQLTIHELSQQGGIAVYERLKEACDEETAILLLGQTLTSSIGESGGAHAAAKVHDEVRWDLIEWDASQLSETVQRDLITPWVRFQHGNDVDVPTFEFQVSPPEDLKQTAETYGALTDMGLPISVAHVYDRFGIEPPAGDEPVLPGKAQPAVANQQDTYRLAGALLEEWGDEADQGRRSLLLESVLSLMGGRPRGRPGGDPLQGKGPTPGVDTRPDEWLIW